MLYPPLRKSARLAETGVFTHFTALQQTWPNVAFNTGGFSPNSGGGSVNSYTGSDQPEWEFADSFTTVHGKHTFGLGFDYRHWRLTRNLDDDFYGDLGLQSAKRPSINTVGCTNPGSCQRQSASSVRHRQCRRRHDARILL